MDALGNIECELEGSLEDVRDGVFCYEFWEIVAMRMDGVSPKYSKLYNKVLEQQAKPNARAHICEYCPYKKLKLNENEHRN